MALIHLITLGCPKNTVDSRHLQAVLAKHDHCFTDNFDEAQVVLINTCGFIKDAKEESIEEILQAVKDSSKIVIVFGCLSKRYKAELQKGIPEVSAYFGLNAHEAIASYIDSLKLPQVSLQSPPLGQPLTSYAYLKIAEGCSRRCSYCVIPHIRGKYVSTAPEQIISEAQQLLSTGVRELVLVAQDITSYGKDLKEDYGGLVRLLRDLTEIDGDFVVRLLYLYPSAITDKLIEEIASNDKIVKYIDIPLQHSEDRILRLMKRTGTRKEYIKLIRRLRREIPELTLRTTFIVGFPSETEEDFEGLLDFVQEIRFDRLGAFCYSDEQGAQAYSLKPKVPERLKKERLETLMLHQAEISYEKNRELVGRCLKAIIDETANDYCIARLLSQAPEIDGVVLLETASLANEPKVADMLDVRITEAMQYDLKAQACSL